VSVGETGGRGGAPGKVPGAPRRGQRSVCMEDAPGKVPRLLAEANVAPHLQKSALRVRLADPRGERVSTAEQSPVSVSGLAILLGSVLAKG